ncbi:MAG TPA: T9SS C-terminal target domain-containing protein [Bacteroidetes bacterium]|nr:T9SS C-terminal target domain-containing protein [Bacteroidota bacterium]
MKQLFIITILFFTGLAEAQNTPFSVAIEPMNIEGLGGIQSYAWGQHDGKWLIVGGRLDGLHQRQPFAAFDAAGHNTQLIVIDPVAKQRWTAPLTSLPTGMQEQLSSTNMQFYQEGNHLYTIGGYGYSGTVGDHTTYAKLTAINVPATISAVINSTAITSHFRQISDAKFAVTGGYLNKIYDTYYLVGGQKFLGRYNPMGPDHGPGFTQEYTDAIHKFTINDNGTTLTITHLATLSDAANLHRRDYNAVPQIMPNGEEGSTAFSGVFQTTVDLPFLNSVDIDSSGYTVNNNFSQYYNHYHCAHIPLYSASQNEMHTVFFGGIAQYFDSAGTLVQDNDVPFVKTIARVTREGNGDMAEYKLPIELPSLLGAGSEFIGVEDISTYPNNVIKLDDLSVDSTLVGYIYGGISSSAANIFFTNTGTQSSASSQIFKVYIIKGKTNGIDILNKQSTSSLQMQVYPNPNKGKFIVQYYLENAQTIEITIQDNQGKLLKTLTQKSTHGENQISQRIEGLTYGGVYFITITTDTEKATQKIILNP